MKKEGANVQHHQLIQPVLVTILKASLWGQASFLNELLYFPIKQQTPRLVSPHPHPSLATHYLVSVC